MTIFLEISKLFIQQEITTIRNASFNADKSIINNALGLIGLERDAELSAAKRTLLDTLSVKITELKASDSDENNLMALKQLIISTRKSGDEKSQQKGYDAGHFGNDLLTAENLIQVIFDKINQVNLLDTPHNSDPLNSFKYHAAMYCTKKAIDRCKLSTIERLLENPKVSSAHKLTAAKEHLIIDKIAECVIQLDTLNKKHPNFLPAYTGIVRDWIEKLQHENAKLLSNYRSSITSTFFNTSRGYLAECMDAATKEIGLKMRSRSEQKSTESVSASSK